MREPKPRKKDDDERFRVKLSIEITKMKGGEAFFKADNEWSKMKYEDITMFEGLLLETQAKLVQFAEKRVV